MCVCALCQAQERERSSRQQLAARDTLVLQLQQQIKQMEGLGTQRGAGRAGGAGGRGQPRQGGGAEAARQG